MKLELKHIACYLPYGLRVNLNRNKGMFRSDNVDLLDTAICYNRTIKETYFKYKDVTYSIFDTTPILRPLSDLTKEIEINGEKFVPIERIKKKMLIDFTYDNSHSVISIKSPSGNTLIGIGDEIVDECPIGFYNQLIKLHFDTKGLIKTGLAIDFNSLK